MDIFTRFNRKAIQDRQVDTLIGISKGLVADNTINEPHPPLPLPVDIASHKIYASGMQPISSRH